MKLWEYVQNHAIRGDCRCGLCIDAADSPEQPAGHTADLVFFEVSKTEEANEVEFRSLIEDEFPDWLNGEEHNYIQMGAEIGDQGAALMAMGLGSLLGLWNLITPKTLGISDEAALQMAGVGMLSIMAYKPEEKSDDQT